MLKIILSVMGLLIAFQPMLSLAESWQVESDDKQKAVMELFTAEGCGLCPAADRWVQQLPQKGITEDQLIVLGFHIDYLNDKKGWVDRFAKPLFSERQRQLARLNLFQTVFTPEFFIGGEVVHNWREYGVEAVEFINGLTSQAAIKLRADKRDQQLHITTKVTVTGEQNRQHSKLYLAVTEDNIISEIRGGDNFGATFNHQNLVRQWLGPFELDQNGQTELTNSLALLPQWKLHDLTLVAIVQNLNDGYTLQGVSIPLTD